MTKKGWEQIWKRFSNTEENEFAKYDGLPNIFGISDELDADLFEQLSSPLVVVGDLSAEHEVVVAKIPPVDGNVAVVRSLPTEAWRRIWGRFKFYNSLNWMKKNLKSRSRSAHGSRGQFLLKGYRKMRCPRRI